MELPKNGIRSGPRRGSGRKQIRVRLAGRIQKKETKKKIAFFFLAGFVWPS
jgi:hypothetical protein